MSQPAVTGCAVRSATSAEAPLLAAFAASAGMSPSTRRSLAADLVRAESDDPRAPVVLVATPTGNGGRTAAAADLSSQTVAGVALGVLQHDEGHVLDLAVDPAQRRQRVGTLLLRALLDALLARGARAATLEVRVGNLGAAALYRDHGFVVEGRRAGYYPDGEDALIMWWRPDPAVTRDTGAGG